MNRYVNSMASIVRDFWQEVAEIDKSLKPVEQLAAQKVVTQEHLAKKKAEATRRKQALKIEAESDFAAIKAEFLRDLDKWEQPDPAALQSPDFQLIKAGLIKTLPQFQAVVQRNLGNYTMLVALSDYGNAENRGWGAYASAHLPSRKRREDAVNKLLTLAKENLNDHSTAWLLLSSTTERVTAPYADLLNFGEG